MKQEIAKKLGIGERSVNLLLLNTELCERILKENPIKFNDFIKKYEVSTNYLKTLIKKGIISSFSNKIERGSYIFIFEDEALNYVSVTYTNNKKFTMLSSIGLLFLTACKDILTQREYDTIYCYYNKQTSENLYDFLSDERINQIRRKAFNKLYRYADRIKLNSEIMVIEDNLKRVLEKKRSIERLPKKQKESKEIEQKKLIKLHDLDLSVRSYNNLKNAKIQYLGELIQYSFDDLAKFRNMGNRSLNEIESKVREYGFELSND